MNTDYNNQYDSYQYELEQKTFMTKVFGWMFLGLLITSLIAYMVATSTTLAEIIASNPLIYWGLAIGEIILVGYLAGWAKKMSAFAATFTFILYAVLNGFTFSIIFAVFSIESIFLTFLITAGMFGVMTLYGFVTKKDLSGWGSILFMGLIGLILASLINMFFNNEMVYWITTYIGIIIFVGLTAYDTQKIKEMNVLGNEGTEEDRKEAIVGALTLYLDFINLFILLLRIFGGRD